MNRIENLHNNVFSKKNVELFEKNIMLLAVVGFIIHLLLIFIENYYALDIFSSRTNLSSNPISALYTPFTFILVYEAFLLIYYLPRSFTTSVAKEYEIISLVLIRKIFKDIPEISLEPDQILNENNLQLMYDLLAVIVIFYLIYLFKKTWVNTPKRKTNKNLEKFINYKKLLSILLVPTLLILCFINFYEWFIQVFISQSYTDNLNGVFFIDFFTILILVDVFILLISFQYTEKYSQLIRNTGFVICTILIRLSFASKGLTNVLLIVSSVLFGLIILRIYQAFEKNI